MKRITLSFLGLTLLAGSPVAFSATQCWNIISDQAGNYGYIKARLTKMGRAGDFRLIGTGHHYTLTNAKGTVAGLGQVQGGRLNLTLTTTVDALSTATPVRSVTSVQASLDRISLSGTYWAIGQQYYQSAVYDAYETGRIVKFPCP